MSSTTEKKKSLYQANYMTCVDIFKITLYTFLSHTFQRIRVALAGKNATAAETAVLPLYAMR